MESFVFTLENIYDESVLCFGYYL